MEGEITESLRNRMFRIRLDNGHEMIGYTAGKMKRYRIRMGPGDRVKVEVPPTTSTEVASCTACASQTMAADRAADRAEELHVELAALLARHEPTLTESDRDALVRLEEGYGWRPGRRPVRPEPKIAEFLDLFDRAEQEGATYER